MIICFLSTVRHGTLMHTEVNSKTCECLKKENILAKVFEEGLERKFFSD
ncbi:hypothetical protein M2146_001133 [Lachnospiraceae bacterium PF1-22]